LNNQQSPQDHFPAKFIDDIAKVGTDANYFSPVWQEAIGTTGGFERMLDIGCGNGIFAAEAKARTGCKLYGVDGSDYALQQAKGIGFEALSLIRDFNVDPLPFESEQFDFCLCKDLLEHLIRPDFVLKEANRVLKPGGYLLVHVPNHFTLHGRIKFLFDNDIDTYRYFPGAKRWDFPHIRFFTHQSMVELLGLKGFRVAHDLSHHFAAIPYGRYLLPFSGMRRKLVNRFPSQFAEGFTFLAQKT
jgi:SAM-dependent methyltransferase